MSAGSLRVALVSEVFVGDGADHRLREVLRVASGVGADVAVLPELPLHPWRPAHKEAREEDAEPENGRCHQVLASAAREVGIATLGGAILRDAMGRRHNTALLFDRTGTLLGRYAKVHIPEEQGFWETSHYEAGRVSASPLEVGGMKLGIQICSDINRPQGTQALAAMGAAAVLNPRATERSTYERWKLVFRANALTSACYVLSVNRPRPELGVELGGPSIAVAPDGNVLLETTDAIAVVDLDTKAVERAHTEYPGYLAVRSDLYADAWRVTPTRPGKKSWPPEKG